MKGMEIFHENAIKRVDSGLRARNYLVLYSSCLDKETISSTIANIEVCLKEVKEWMGRNHLMMNEEKTEFV